VLGEWAEIRSAALCAGWTLSGTALGGPLLLGTPGRDSRTGVPPATPGSRFVTGGLLRQKCADQIFGASLLLTRELQVRVVIVAAAGVQRVDARKALWFS